MYQNSECIWSWSHAIRPGNKWWKAKDINFMGSMYVASVLSLAYKPLWNDPVIPVGHENCMFVNRPSWARRSIPCSRKTVNKIKIGNAKTNKQTKKRQRHREYLFKCPLNKHKSGTGTFVDPTWRIVLLSWLKQEPYRPVNSVQGPEDFF